jgi:tetratricopeptide (TPR) repeat protein
VSGPLLLELFEQFERTGNLIRYGQTVTRCYTEGTLQRLLSFRSRRVREAVLVALKQKGTMASNALLAACLHDDSNHLQRLAEEALWAVWARGDNRRNGLELRRVIRLINDQDYEPARASLNELIERAPRFAEAYNQRAILHWRLGDYRGSIADCEEALGLNPHHFGALTGMGQCYVQLHRPKEALKAFRRALAVHPGLHGVAEMIQRLKSMVNDEGGD